MSYPSTVTFQRILQDVSAAEAPAYTTGTDLSAVDRLRRRSFANTAMDWIWRPPNRMFAWDFSVATKTVTVTNGNFPMSEIDNSDWWSIWSQDPRPFNNPTTSTWPSIRGRITAYKDGSGLYPQASNGDVFVFYRQAAPQFSCVAVVAGTTYPAGSVVYDEDATGDCYVALVSALGSAIADPTKWQRQYIPQQIGNVLQNLIIAQLRDAIRSSGASATADKKAQEWLDLEMMRQFPQPFAGPPWAINGNGLYVDGFNRY